MCRSVIEGMSAAGQSQHMQRTAKSIDVRLSADSDQIVALRQSSLRAISDVGNWLFDHLVGRRE